MNALFHRWLAATTRHRVWVLLTILAFTVIATVGRINPEWIIGGEEPTSGPQGSTSSAASSTALPPDVSPLRVDNADVVLIVDSKSFFTPAGSRAIRDVVDSIEALSMVQDIFWLDEVPPINLFSLQNPIFPTGTASARQFEDAREQALANPLIRGQLLSEDAETLLLLIHLDWLFVESDEQCTELIRQTAQQVDDQYEDVDMSFLVTGRVPGYITFEKSRGENQKRYQVIGYSMILIMAVILFRGFRAVLIVSAAPILGVFWTLGFLCFFDLQENPFNDIVLPVLISLVGFTDGVHLMVEIRRRRANGDSPRTAAAEALQKVGLACFLTSLTTAIGLGALSLAHHEVVREFGWSCVIGVVLTFFAVILVIPLLCSTRLGNRLEKGHGEGLVDRSLGRIEVVIDWVLQRRKAMTFCAIGLTLTLVGISLTLRPDERVQNALPTNSEVTRAIAHLDDKLNGMETAEVRIHWTDKIDNDSEEILNLLRDVHVILDKEELIGHPVSLKSFIDALPGDPDAAQRMSMAELLPPALKRVFITPERRMAKVTFRVRDLGIATYGPVFERIETALRNRDMEQTQFNLSLQGDAVWRWRNLQQIVVDLTYSLGSASIVIFLVLTIAYRSIRIGLIALVPNFFPLAFTGTWLVATGHSLELAMVCAFTVCLGIAVDDTIHFLTRYREESDDKSDEDAIRSAFVSTGTALIMTTVILTVGFSTVIMSGMREQRIFATMGCLTISSALLGDLLFLPPMLAYFRKRRKATTDENQEIKNDS
ncbi:MAG: MMPL family transporter [Planctomycetaceae bacterium]|nr:MMPL family transporter [Planctomycetaceae bacterium]